MAITYKFVRKDKNRYRKIYNYIRKKPIYEYCTDKALTMIVGTVEFDDENKVVFTYTDADPTVAFINIPVITAISHDSETNNAADVNIFLTAVTNTQATFESSNKFKGKVHFHIISQDIA